MKAKKLFSCLALTLCATTLTACVKTDKHVAFSYYWYQDADIPTQTTETLVYDVSFKQDSGLAQNFTVDYKGTMTTRLQKTDENKYRYESSLVMDVTYTLNGEQCTLQDTVNAWVEFKNDKSLSPIASHKEIVNHSPANLEATKLEECYVKYDYTLDTTYQDGLASGETKMVNNETETTQSNSFEFDNKLTVLDNELLLLALRGINPKTYSAPSFAVYAPFTNAVQTIKASFGTKEEGTEFTFKKDGEEEKKSRVINYYPVTLSIDAKNPGQSQTVWVAETNDSKSNLYRNAILRLETPISYNLGTLVYELASAEFSKNQQ